MIHVDPGPVNFPPVGHSTPADHEVTLHAVLSGVELGAYDRRLLADLAQLHTCDVATFASLIIRARAAGPLTPASRARLPRVPDPPDFPTNGEKSSP